MAASLAAAGHRVPSDEANVNVPPVSAVARDTHPNHDVTPSLPEGATMILVGTVLIGVAAAVRRTA